MINPARSKRAKMNRSFIKKPRRLLASLLLVLGIFFTGLGFLGIFLPVLPTTPFLLLAAACFARSSEKFYRWLLGNPWFGPYIKNYREKRGIPVRIKVYSISLLWFTISLTILFAVNPVWLKGLLILIAAGVTRHILSIKTLKRP